MVQGDQNIVIVFHSYPNKPCIDGLMSAIITCTLYRNSKISLVPYWRTQDSFKRLKSTLDDLNLQKTTIIYADCSPELKEEVDYLMDIIPNTREVLVYDHHPLNGQSVMNVLFEKENFKFEYDAENCAAMMMYGLLTKDQKEELQLEDLLTIVQFSEYEGMNPKVAGEDNAEKLARKVLQQTMETSQDEISGLLQQIIHQNVVLYFILDEIVNQTNDWKFLYDKSLNHTQLFELFWQRSTDFLSRCNEILTGKDENTFTKSNLENYFDKMFKQLPKKFELAQVLRNKRIGDISCDVLVVALSIFEFGRTLEPLLRREMKKTGTSYAILMNPPTTNQEKQKQYYFSLRRENEKLDARNLVQFIKNATGTKIGGGHPWGSGVTLSEEQYQIFKEML